MLIYRRDAEIQRPYGRIVTNSKDYKMPTIAEINKRTKKIAWFVSHCESESERDVLAQKINKYIKVDIYGNCGNLKCPKEKMGECYNMMENEYKFYLSFENSYCKDYVTEKLFNILERDIVPIVYGGADYENINIAPPHSVIDVTKYNSVTELSNYLKYLDTHPEEYLKYFEWKKNYSVDGTPHGALCSLCRKVNEPRKKTVYEDISSWVYYPEYCKSGGGLPPIIYS